MSFRTTSTATSIAYNTLSLIPAIPPGTLMPFAGTVAPRGWMMCDGRSLSKSQYEKLYRAIGDTYGSSSSEFSIPDMRGRVIVGVSEMRPLAETGGSETHTLSVDEMPVHNHIGTTDSNGAHVHSITDRGHTHTQTTINDDFNASGTNPPGFTSDSAGTRVWDNINSATTGIEINSNGAHTHSFTTQNKGNGEAHNNMQPYLSLHYIIRVI